MYNNSIQKEGFVVWEVPLDTEELCLHSTCATGSVRVKQTDFWVIALVNNWCMYEQTS